MGQPLWTTVWQFLRSLNTESPSDHVTLPHTQEKWKRTPHQNLHQSVLGSIIQNSRNVERAQCLPAQPYHRALFSREKERSTGTCYDVDENVSLSERSRSQKATCSMIPLTRDASRMKQSHRNGKEMRGCQGPEGERMRSDR